MGIHEEDFKLKVPPKPGWLKKRATAASTWFWFRDPVLSVVICGGSLRSFERYAARFTFKENVLVAVDHIDEH